LSSVADILFLFIHPEIFRFRVVDIIDILLFAILLYEIYNLVKGTAAIKIFLGIIAVYIIWKIVSALQMQLLDEILGEFITVGVIALIVVFQPEIRQFLLILGNTRIIRSRRKRFLFWNIHVKPSEHRNFDEIIRACKKMSDSKTGALIVITRRNELTTYAETGQRLDATLSDKLLETIFFRNSPLHDGAVIIVGDHVRAARCILPVSASSAIPAGYGLRHRAAVGITERTDAIAVIVSEETGEIAYSIDGHFIDNIPPASLTNVLGQIFER
jgi:uncharacterized protein (TIGR00159 family)